MIVEVKNKLIYKDGETLSCLESDEIARANKHPNSNTPMGYAKQFTEYHNNKKLVLDEKLKIINDNKNIEE